MISETGLDVLIMGYVSIAIEKNIALIFGISKIKFTGISIDW